MRQNDHHQSTGNQRRRFVTSTSHVTIDGITVAELATSDHRAFEQMLALYREAFPPEERKPSDTLRQMLARPDYRFWVAHRNEQVVTFAIIYTSSTHPMALLEYLAVHRSLRGLGLGRHLLQHLVPVLLEAHRSVLIEIESDKPATPDRALRSKRKQFYRSFGAREIAGLRYLMPQVSTGTPPPMDLLLLASDPRGTLPGSTLRSWLTCIYAEVYNQSPADPRLTAMLASLPEEIALV